MIIMKIEVLQKDMIAAMKEKNKEVKDALSSTIAAIKKAAIDEGTREDIPEELVDRIILKELKSLKEQIDTCPDERVDLKEQYQSRYDIVSQYAPKLLSKDEVKAIISDKFSEVLATKNKGMIMKTIMAELKGKADGKDINAAVAELLQ